MDGKQLKAIRLALGLGQAQFALDLGYGGNEATRQVLISQFESGTKPIPSNMEARFAAMRGWATIPNPFLQKSHERV